MLSSGVIVPRNKEEARYIVNCVNTSVEFKTLTSHRTPWEIRPGDTSFCLLSNHDSRPFSEMEDLKVSRTAQQEFVGQIAVEAQRQKSSVAGEEKKPRTQMRL